MAISGVVIIWSASGGGASRGLNTYFVAGGAVSLVLGSLMLIPALLALAGRLGTHLVLPLRLAARDTARQRARSTPAVAAIMAAVAALTALSIGAASDTRQRELEYQPQSAIGHGRISLLPWQETHCALCHSDLCSRTRNLAGRHRGTRGNRLRSGEDGGWGAGTRKQNGRLRSQATPDVQMPRSSAASATGPDGPINPRCVRLGAGVQEPHGQIQVISLETLNATTSVSEAERRVLRSGGMLVLDPNLKQGGFVEFVAGRTNVGTAEPAHGHACRDGSSAGARSRDRPQHLAVCAC